MKRMITKAVAVAGLALTLAGAASGVVGDAPVVGVPAASADSKCSHSTHTHWHWHTYWFHGHDWRYYNHYNGIGGLHWNMHQSPTGTIAETFCFHGM